MTIPPFVALVPARMASTRFPGKVLADIAGTPMVLHCAQRAQESGASRVVIATDHTEVRRVAEAAGWSVVMTATTHETGTDRLAEAVAHLDLTPDTLVVNVQGDEPLLDPATIRAVVQRLHDRPDCTLATAAYPITSRAHLEQTNAVKVVLDHQDMALYFSRAPIPWARDAWAQDAASWPEDLPAWHHVGLYAYRVSFLRRFAQLSPAPLERHEALEQLRALWYGYRIAVVRLMTAPLPGVDTPEDLARVCTAWATRGAYAGTEPFTR